MPWVGAAPWRRTLPFGVTVWLAGEVGVPGDALGGSELPVINAIPVGDLS